MRILSIAIGLLALAVPVIGFAQQPPPAQPAQPQVQPPPPPPPSVKVGEAAPDFTLPYLQPLPDAKIERKEMKLSDFKGKQNVVLAFFPAAFSPG